LENLQSTIASNLKQLRQERNLSLNQLAQLSGVSKSMLGQIERGEVNPTISIMWKIADGLKVSFTQMLTLPISDVDVIRKNNTIPMVDDEGKFRNFPLFPYDSGRKFELYNVELDPNGELSSDPHPAGIEEFVTVFSGELTMTVSGNSYTLKEGDAIRFNADLPHIYINNSDVTAHYSMIIYYP
jgi:transcriptional regulator with XRE-family HTH domain